MLRIVLLIIFVAVVVSSSAQQYISFYSGTNWPNGTTSATNLRSDADNRQFTSYSGCVYADVTMSGTWRSGGYPRYTNAGATYGFGMELSVDWANCTSSSSMTITFKSSSGGPVTAYPVSFSILGLNSHVCGATAANRFIDRVTIEGYAADLTTPVSPTITKTCTDAVLSGTTLTGTSSCGSANTNKAADVSFSSVARIVITYSSGTGHPPTLSCGTNPSPLAASDNPRQQEIYISAFKLDDPGYSAPTGITGTTTVCTGVSTTLTATGGNSTSRWYTGSCGGTLVHTGSTYSVAPSSTTTYYVANSNLCGITSCASTTVTVNNPSATGLAAGDWLWTGIVNTSWQNSANWRSYNGSTFSTVSTPPSSTTNIRIKPTGTCINNNLLIDGTATAISSPGSNDCRNMTIESGGVVTFQNGGNRHLHVTGNYSNSGTMNYNDGRIKFVGTGAQSLYDASGTATFYELNVASSSNLTINSNLTITNDLRLNGEIIVSSGKELYVSKAATGAVIQTGSGRVRLESQNGTSIYYRQINSVTAQDFVYHLGDASGNLIPLTFRLNSGNLGKAGVSTYRCSDVSNSANWPTGTENVTYINPSSYAQTVKRFWHLYTNQTTYNVDVTFSFNSADDPSGGLSGSSFNVHRYNKPTNLWNFPSDFYNLSPYSTTSNLTSNPRTARVSGVDKFSWWGITVLGAPLPVNLAYFKANCINNGKAELKWQTLSEINADRFEVERSTDGENFSVIANVPASGNSNTPKNYAYIDNLYANTTYYYRLNQYDFDGTKHTFEIKTINCEDNSLSLEVIFPVPVVENINLEILSSYNRAIQLEVYNALGQIVYSSNLNIEAGSNNINVDNFDIANGAYLLKITDVLDQRVFLAKQFVVNR